VSVLLALGASACGLVAGLSGYGAELEDAAAHGSSQEPSTTDAASSGDEAAVGPEGNDATVDAGTGDEPTTELIDPGDSSDDGGDAGPPIGDAGDGGEDAEAVCKAQCGGCCDSTWVCHGGQSVGTCGAGAQACMNCGASNKVCSSAGACVTAPIVDASPPAMCNATKCTNKCPLLEGPCCKSDQTCGCAVLGLLLCN
jgi:hypothetical protein